jgi:hypothetical protein
MNKERVEIMQKITSQNAMGIPQETFTSIKTIGTDYIMPYSDASALKDFGFIVHTTHRTYTHVEVVPGSFLKDAKGNVYRINQVARYPRIFALVLEWLHRADN